MHKSNLPLRCPPRKLQQLRHVAVVVSLLLVVSACSSGSDEDQVRAVIAAAEEAAEARDTSQLMDLVADDYADGRNFDKAQLTQYLRGYFLLHPKIEIVTRIGEIEFETANRARVPVEVAMVGLVSS